MKRLALVVQRCHESVVGGSESLAWQYAKLLSTNYKVEILSSCATDYTTWQNVLPSGATPRDGIVVRRFPTAFERTAYFTELHRRLLDQFSATADRSPEQRIPWRRALQEEFIKFQGPYCPDLIEYLRSQHSNYDAVLFFTYLYPTTHLGAEAVPGSKCIFIPTLHDEPTAYLSTFRERALEFADIIWLAPSERAVATRLWGIEHGQVLGMAVSIPTASAKKTSTKPYLLYCGRIDENKGSKQLISAFLQLRKRSGTELRLVLTGSKHMDIPNHRDIEFLGFVDEKRKAELMAGALAFVLPSEYESFSIVTLEAMAQGTPVVLNGRCGVLRDHIELSQGGYWYQDEKGLMQALERMCQLPTNERKAIGAAGRRYVVENYNEMHIRKRLTEIVNKVANATST